MHGTTLMRVFAASLPACMGGWCELREDCSRYHAATDVDPVDRLCEMGHDGIIDGYPVILLRPAGTWGRRHATVGMLRTAQPFDSLEDGRAG